MFKNLMSMSRELVLGLIPFMTAMVNRSVFTAVALLILSTVIVPFGANHRNCWAADMGNGSVTDNHGPGLSGSSPEKLFEAVSGYLESLHRVRSNSKNNAANGMGREQKRDASKIVVKPTDQSRLVQAELKLARSRVQRGEFELASQPLQRAFQMASNSEKDLIRVFSGKIEEIGKTHWQASSEKPSLGPDTANAIGMKFVLIPSGSFVMGSSASEIRRIRAEWNVPENLVEPETPDHKVEISHAFLIGKYDVTVGQFKRFVSETGYKTVAEIQGWGWSYDKTSKHWVKRNGLSWRNPGFEVYDDCPVTMVSYADAEAFCDWLSSRDGRRYTLPTEAQWEYCARGGKTGERFPWGNNYPDGKKLNMADRNCIVPWSDRSIDDGYAFISPIGAYDPNGFRLYDMVGNVWQLCSDYFDSKEYKKKSGVNLDPTGPKTGKTKVVRGGSWAFDACEARNAFRFGVDPKLCADMIGFRVVTVPDSRDRGLVPVNVDFQVNAPMTNEHVNAIFNRIEELVRSGKRLQARNLVDRIPELQDVQKGCLEDTSGFVKDVLRGFIDETSNKSIESFENSLGMRMVRISEGSFVMGSSEADIAWAMTVLARGQPLSLENEYPFHKVRISQPFFMADTPVTVQQFQAFVDDTGYITDAEDDNGGEVFDIKVNRFVRKAGSSWRNPGWKIEPDQPVVMITHNDAVAFCEWLSAKERSAYKLPTEAQWEYAARGGLPMEQFPWGDQLPDGKRANYADRNTDFEWRDRDVNDGYKYVSPVGSYAPNGFGLYDMAGNVLQWVRDFYQEDYYRYTPEIDPEGPGQGENMVMRGGDFTSGAVSLRCAFRGWAKPDLALNNGGFRVIMDTSSPQRPFHFSVNFLTQQWVPNPEQREVAQALAKEKERSLKRSTQAKGTKVDQPERSATNGILIIEFTPKSDAKKFGLLRGDVIIEYDGVTDLDSDKLIALTARTKRERRRPIIKFVRDGYLYSLQVPPGSLGISITDTVLRGPFKQNEFEQDRDKPNSQNGKKKKQWM